MVGLGNLLAHACTLSLHFASQDVLVYPAPHEDLPSGSDQQAPPTGPDAVLSGVLEVFAPTERTIPAIKVVLKGSQTVAIPDTLTSAGQAIPTIRYEDATTFSRTIEITAEHHVSNPKGVSRSSRSSSSADLRAVPGQDDSNADIPSAAESVSSPGVFLPRGTSFFSFTFILPATLAPTERCKNGRLRYSCTAHAIGGGRARSNTSSPARDIFVIALPQPDNLATSAPGRAANINREEGLNAPGMPTPISLDVQFHDYHQSLGILSVSLTALSLTVGAIATLSIYHPSPPPLLSVHTIRVTLEQTTEVYNRLRRGWMRFPVEKYKLWEAGHMPFKKVEEQPLRPRPFGAASPVGGQHEDASSRRSTAWEDSVWVGSDDGGKGRPGNAIRDRLYLSNSDALVAAQAHAQSIHPDQLLGPSSADPRRPGTNSTSYFGSRPSSPDGIGKSRSAPNTPGALSRHSDADGTHMAGKITRIGDLLEARELRPHPHPLFATACDNPSHPFLSAISGAWVDKPAPGAGEARSTPTDGPSSYRLRALLRMPSDDHVHPSTLRGTKSDIHHTHEAVVEIYFSRANVFSEEKGKEGRPKLQVFSMRKKVVIQSCVVTPDMIHLPPYLGQVDQSSSAPGSVSHDQPPIYQEAVNERSSFPNSPLLRAQDDLAPSRASTRHDSTASAHEAPTQRSRPSFLRRMSSPSRIAHGSHERRSTRDRHEQEMASQQSHSHLRNTLSAILHPHSHMQAHGSVAQPQAGRNSGTGSRSMLGSAAVAAAASLAKRSGQSGATMHTSTATAPPSRAPSRTASRDSSPTRADHSAAAAPRQNADHGSSASAAHSGADAGSSGEGHGSQHQHSAQQQQHHHHHRRNEFTFGFTPSSARRGEGQDADHPSQPNERHAHFIPAQVIGKERGRTLPGSGTASPASRASQSLSHSPSASVAVLSTGSGSSERLSRAASAQQLADAETAQLQQMVNLSGGDQGHSSSSGAPPPAHLANALRQLQLSQTGDSSHTAREKSAMVPGSVASPIYDTHISTASAPGSGTHTPGGTLVTSGPNLPPEWNLLMAPGERTNTTHATCMCGRTTESLLKAERLLMGGAPTAPYFTPSPGPSPYQSHRPSVAALGGGSPAPSSSLHGSGGRDELEGHSPVGIPSPQEPRFFGHSSGADDPDGILLTEGMGSDGRQGATHHRPQGVTMRRSISASEADGRGGDRQDSLHASPSDRNEVIPQDQLESLFPADEFILARGRDPAEILRRKNEMMSL
ncbi:hypothetical protein OC861_004922 [Tilletia horrida]|nr:hypothetical protein OC845_000372 [Tilletia horrida]KAK0563194.1 hypothetical protein OC861_004922 [Tilletia horrida]